MKDRGAYMAEQESSLSTQLEHLKAAGPGAFETKPTGAAPASAPETDSPFVPVRDNEANLSEFIGKQKTDIQATTDQLAAVDAKLSTLTSEGGKLSDNRAEYRTERTDLVNKIQAHKDLIARLGAKGVEGRSREAQGRYRTAVEQVPGLEKQLVDLDKTKGMQASDYEVRSKAFEGYKNLKAKLTTKLNDQTAALKNWENAKAESVASATINLPDGKVALIKPTGGEAVATSPGTSKLPMSGDVNTTIDWLKQQQMDIVNNPDTSLDAKKAAGNEIVRLEQQKRALAPAEVPKKSIWEQPWVTPTISALGLIGSGAISYKGIEKQIQAGKEARDEADELEKKGYLAAKDQEIADLKAALNRRGGGGGGGGGSGPTLHSIWR